MKHKYRDTLNLSSTPFNMKANLGVRELEFQQKWLDQAIYQKILKKNANNPHWILHDGPPYANGNIHVGHAVNKILKDFIIRIKSFQGFYSPYIAGWDTHGLPIEWALIKQKKNIDPKLTSTQKRQNCKSFATEQIEIQKQQFARLGLLSDLKETYLTYNHDFEMDQLAIFAKMIMKNLIYRDLKPVYWSWSSKTALAEAEVVYQQQESDSIYVKFYTTEAFKQIPVGTNVLIWTTTPWTLPSNLAVAVHPDYQYVLVKVENEHYLLAESRLTALTTLFHWSDVEILAHYKGSELEYLKYNNPLLNEEHFVVIGDYVSADDGTGLVHNAPGFGLDDYLVCKNYNIPVYCPINGDGKFTNQVKLKELENIFYEDANEIIINRLKAQNTLLLHEVINHSAAHDWRTNKPLIYRATNQWFVNIDEIKNDIIQACSQINTRPEWMLKQLQETVLRRKEWCISRQRLWGVPIPILFDANEEPILDVEQINYIINILQQKGCDAWFDLEATAFLAPKYQHLKNVIKSQDIMDVWFDSGTSYSILARHGLNHQSQLYLEGSDQFRGWFNSSLITSVIAYGQSPYQNLISHGFVLDEHGFKMSKSKNNVVDPLQIAKENGADVLRLWVALTDYSEDMRLGKTIFEQAIGAYRKIRNSLLRFSLANLVDFHPETDLQTEFNEVHNYILHLFKKMVQKFLQELSGYNFYKAMKEFNIFITFYSSWYLNLIKDSLYCDAIKSKHRLQAQSVLYKILQTSLVLLAPIMPHTADEAHSFFNQLNKQESVHLESWIDLESLGEQVVNEAKWSEFFKLKELVNEAVEQARTDKLLKQNSEAHIILDSEHQITGFSSQELQYLLMVGELQFEKNFAKKIEVKKTALNLCERCKLHYFTNQMASNELCFRCFNVLEDNPTE